MLPGTGSGTSCEATVTVFVIVPNPESSKIPLIVRLADALLLSVPIFTEPVHETHPVPSKYSADEIITGSIISVTSIFVAALGPLFVIVMLYCIGPPMINGDTVSSLVTTRSAEGCTTVFTDDVLLSVTGS